MAVYELVNAVQSTRETPSRWINVESVLETIEDIRSAFPEMEGRSITVRLIDPRFPLPEWTVFERKQLRLVRDKKTVENYGEALY